MKNFYNINKWLIIITVLLYFTFWGGILAQIVLGFGQILTSIIIIKNYSSIPKQIKKLFEIYTIATILTTPTLLILYFKFINDIIILIYFTGVTILLALFHLYITYKIKQS